MVWLPHKKYTNEYVAAQLAEISANVHRETRRMILVVTGAVGIMVFFQITGICGL